MRIAWALVACLIGVIVIVGGSFRLMSGAQNKGAAGVGGAATVLNKIAHQRTALPRVTTPSASPDLVAYRSTATVACRRLRHEIVGIPPATPPRVRFQHIAQSMDGFVSTLAVLPAPSERQTAAGLLLTAARSYQLHVRMAAQALITRDDTSAERMSLNAARQDLQEFGAARAMLGVSC
jgi:hypothetical protein